MQVYPSLAYSEFKSRLKYNAADMEKKKKNSSKAIVQLWKLAGNKTEF